MDNTPPSGRKKKKKRIEDVVEEELLAVLQGNVLVGREERGAQALVKPIGQGEDRQTNPLVRGQGEDKQTRPRQPLPTRPFERRMGFFNILRRENSVLD